MYDVAIGSTANARMTSDLADQLVLKSEDKDQNNSTATDMPAQNHAAKFIGSPIDGAYKTVSLKMFYYDSIFILNFHLIFLLTSLTHSARGISLREGWISHSPGPSPHETVSLLYKFSDIQ